MPVKKWTPRKGQTFESRDELETKLLEAGWEFEGHDTGFDNGISSYNIGVQDKKKNLWLMIDMKPFRDKVRVTRVKKLKIKG